MKEKYYYIKQINHWYPFYYSEYGNVNMFKESKTFLKKFNYFGDAKIVFDSFERIDGITYELIMKYKTTLLEG